MALCCLAPQGEKWKEGVRFGRCVLAISDLDGDGVREFAVGAPADPRGLSKFSSKRSLGRVFVLSGATRKVIGIWNGQPGLSLFGHTLRDAGDVDGDGIPDVLAGYEYEKVTDLRSGIDGSLLAEFPYNYRDVAEFGDLDSDGYPDYIMGGEGRWEIRSGKSGKKLVADVRLECESEVHWVGDRNGDGLSDGLSMGEKPMEYVPIRPKEWPSAPALASLSISIVDLTESWGLALKASASFTKHISTAGDLDGDGRAESVIWTEIKNQGRGVVIGAGARSTSRLLIDTQSSDGVRGGWFGYANCHGMDANGDGVGDLIVADPIRLFSCGLRAYSGKDGTVLWRISPPDVGAISGHSLAIWQDGDGDGVQDILVGTSHWDWIELVSPGGNVKLISGKTGKVIWEVSGAECVNAVTPVRDSNEEGPLKKQ